MKKSLLVLISISCLCFLNGCGGSSQPAPTLVATHFSVTVAATTQTAGTAFSIVVTALDSSNAAVTTYSGKAHFASTDSQAVLPPDSTLANGTGTFTVTFKTASPQTITASDTMTASITGSSSAIIVGPGAASHFSVSAPAAATASMPFNFTVTALDTYSNVAAGYSGTTHFSSTDLQAVLPPNSTLTNGTGTFSATLKMIANTTIAATDSVASSISGASTSINVFSNAATHFIINAPSGTTTRASISFIVSALDGANNLSTVYAGTVHFSSTDTKALLPSNSALSNGTGPFSAALETAGNQTISTTDTVAPSITGSSTAINVAAAGGLTISSSSPPNGIVAVNYGPSRSEIVACSWRITIPGTEPVWGCTPCVPAGRCVALPHCMGQRISPCQTTTEVFTGFAFTATGGVPPYNWSASSLPPGLNVNSTSGDVTGTPTVAGTYKLALTLTDSGTPQATTPANYPIVIVNPPPPIISTTPAPSAGAISLSYSFAFTVTGGLLPLGLWSETGPLPPGLLFNSSDGVLSGTPTAAGIFPISVMVQDAAGQSSAPQDFNIQIFAHGFQATSSMASSRFAHTATLLNTGKVLIAGWGNATAELFDPATGIFAPTGSMLSARVSHTATLLNTGKVLLTGGIQGAPPNTTVLAESELYDPGAGTFSQTLSSLATAREWHTASLLPDGKVLVTGGLNSAGNAIAAVELFDPSSQGFTPAKGNMETARAFHTSTALKDGTVLVTGGDDGTAPLGTAEVYDPTTGVFSPTGSMGTARQSHTATLLSDGKVLVIGGANGIGALATAERYQ